MSRLTVVSWNVRMGLHNDGGENDLVAALARLDADVIALQEACRPGGSIDFATDIGRELGYRAYAYCADRPPRSWKGKWTVAVLSRLPARRLAGPTLPTPARRLGREGVSILLTDSGLRLCCVHLFGVHAIKHDPRLLLREHRLGKQLAGDFDIVCGDMNMWGPFVNRSLRPLEPTVRGRTWPSNRRFPPHSQIDHMLVSSRVRPVASEVLDDMGSDHRAIRAEFEILD